jgi:hypothetical protein
MIGMKKKNGKEVPNCVPKESVKEAMDPVDAKALKGKHSERKDKDIDNDGDVDKSDEYLHKRRQAISKALAKEGVDTSAEKKLDEAIEISHDRYMSSHGKKAKGSGQWAFTTKSKGEPSKNEMVFVSGDLTSAAKEAAKKLGANRIYVMEEVELNEAYTINHKTFSAAVQHAKAQVEKQGYTIDDDEWDRKVAMGPRKPGTGKTNRYTIDLMKGGKETKRKLQMQVYYDEGRYELNMYVS